MKSKIARLVLIGSCAALFGITAPVAQAATATTLSAASVTATSARLSATIVTGGLATSWQFQYGTTIAYGKSSVIGQIPATTAQTTVSVIATNLSPATTYHFRVVVTSVTGNAYYPLLPGAGGDVTFTTSSRIALFGHTAFVSPSGVAGVMVGCLGQTSCVGHMTIFSGTRIIATRGSFTVAADDGGFVHLRLNSLGRSLIRKHPHLTVKVNIADTAGSSDSKTVTLVHFS